MRNVWKIIKDDFKLLFSNVISIVVVIGLVVVPGMYVWFNLAGVWDPYNNVDNLEVAIVNEDQGYKSEILPMDLKVGNTLVSALHENKGFKWAFTEFDYAMNKLNDGTYYAVIVIPQDFSNQLLSIISGQVESANLIYYSNEKNNPIAPKITGKGASAIQQKINTAFSNTVYSILLKTASNVFNSGAVDDASNVGSSLVSVMTGAANSMESLIGEINMLQGEVSTLKDVVDNTREFLPSSSSDDIKKIHEALDQVAEEIKASTATLQGLKEILSLLPISTKMIDDMLGLLQTMSNSINQAHKIIDLAISSGDSLDVTLESVSNLLDNVNSQINSTGETFSLILSDLNTAREKISALSSASSIEDIRNIIGQDSNSFANLITSPVYMERHAVFHMENNAASMSGFYISICVWVGALILAALLKSELSKKREHEFRSKNLKNWQIYLGRYAVFGALSLAQVTFIGLGCLFFLQIPCVHPFLYMISLWLISICYSLFIYTLLASFGSIGKALAVILLVLQICATGGTFPIQLVSEPFQIISPYLPGTYSLKALNMCVAGFTNFDLVLCLMDLALTMIPVSLIIGLILRNPIIKVNEKFVKKVRKANLLGI